MNATTEIIIQLGIGNISVIKSNNGATSTKVKPMKNDFVSGTALILSNIGFTFSTKFRKLLYLNCTTTKLLLLPLQILPISTS